jgi:ABC-type phosphate transport system auxiliary subunit
MPTPAQQTAIAQAITSIRSAENLLTDQIQTSSDTLKAIKLTHEYNNLDSYLSELLHAQNAADDASFAVATQALQTRTDGLQADEAKIKKIVADVATAGKVVGYITDALAFIAKL